MFWKYLYWKKGISTREFMNEYSKDVRDVIDINNAFEDKNLRTQNLNNMLSKVRF